MCHNTGTSLGIKYDIGDVVYYKQKNCNYWKEPGTVINQDVQHVLVKNSSTYKGSSRSQLQVLHTAEKQGFLNSVEGWGEIPQGWGDWELCWGRLFYWVLGI